VAGQGLAQNVLELIAQLLDLPLLALLLGQQLLQVVVGFLFSVGVLAVQIDSGHSEAPGQRLQYPA
jgi:hypothetical protein